MIWVMKIKLVTALVIIFGISLLGIYSAGGIRPAKVEATEVGNECDEFDETGFCISCNGGGTCEVIICRDGKHYDEVQKICVPDVTPTPTDEVTPTPTDEVTPTPTDEMTPTPTPTPTPTCPPDSSLENGICMHPQPQLAPPSSDGRSDGLGGQAPSPQVLGASTLAATGGEDEFGGYVDSDSRLVIDYLDTNLPVIVGGLSGDQWLLSNQAILKTSTKDLTGVSENTILYGHNWTSLLGAIGRIEAGNELEYDGDTFVVVNVQKVSALETDVLKPLMGQTLTIYTCTGTQNELRFVVTAIRK